MLLTGKGDEKIKIKEMQISNNRNILLVELTKECSEEVRAKNLRQ